MSNLARLPLSAFDPRLRSLIEKGCREMVEVVCDTTRKAQHLRNVLTTFRARLKQEYRDDPDLWEPLYGAIISTKRGFPSIVTVRPRHGEFSAILDNMDLTPYKAPPLAEDPLEAILAEIQKENGNGTPE